MKLVSRGELNVDQSPYDSKQAAQMARIDNWNSGFALGDKRLGDEHFAH